MEETPPNVIPVSSSNMGRQCCSSPFGMSGSASPKSIDSKFDGSIETTEDQVLIHCSRQVTSCLIKFYKNFLYPVLSEALRDKSSPRKEVKPKKTDSTFQE
jgi:hypothetical protein